MLINETTIPSQRPEIQYFIESFLLANLPNMQSLNLLAHKYVQNHIVGRQFAAARQHGDWQYFLNSLDTETLISLYEGILIAKVVLCETTMSLKFMADE